jgi:WD40 repeat protein
MGFGGGGGIVRWWRFAVVAVAGALTATAGTALAVAVNVATGGSAGWFPPVAEHPAAWTAGATAAGAAAWLAAWQAQRWYERGLAVLVPTVQRPDSWVVRRPDEVRQVVRALRSGGSVGITTAVHGAGGFGKTTVAAMVRADQRVLRRFGRRVYWVTVGRDLAVAGLAEKINDLVRQMDGGKALSFTDTRQAADHLAAVLASGPRRLVIIDDVWTEEQLAAFPVAGQCARLVTTRNPSLVAGTAVLVKVDQMSERQARDVITVGLPAIDRRAVAELVAASGRWPLLLRLVNKNLAAQGRLSTDISAAALQLLNQLRAEGALRLTDPQATAAGTQLDVGDPDQRRRAVRATIEASVGLLESASRRRVAELATFAEDETVPVSLAVTLWQAASPAGSEIGQAAAEMLMTRLDDLALVSLIPSSSGGAWTMHDVIRDFLRDELGESRLRQLHELLISTARAALPPTTAPALAGSTDKTLSAWWELPEDARYLRGHLIEHLLAAGQSPEAAAVATDLRWATARLDQFGASGAFADLALVGTPQARRLGRLLAQAAHLLTPTAPPYCQVDILLSRVGHDPEWGPQARAVSDSRAKPALVSNWPLPDLPEPALRRVIRAHNGPVLAMAITSDGAWLATAGHDRTVRIWDTIAGQLRTTLIGGQDWVDAVAVAPDGTWLATADIHGRVRLHDTATGRSRVIHAGSRGQVRATAIVSDGSRMATADNHGTLRIHDTATGRSRVIHAGYRGRVRAVAIAGESIWLSIFSSHTSRSRADDGPAGRGDTVNALAIAPDASWLAVADSDGSVRIWDTVTGQPRATLADHHASAGAVAIAPDGTWLATADFNDTVRIWDAATGQPRTTLTGRQGFVAAMAIASDGAWMASADQSGSVRIWDTAASQSDPALTDRHEWIRAATVATDGTWLATVDSRGAVRFWGAATGQLRATTHLDLRGDFVDDFRESVNEAAIAPDGTWLVTADSGGAVRIWDAATGQPRATLTGIDDSEAELAIAPDGTWLATAGDDKIVRIWDAATGELRVTLTGHRRSVSAVAIAPDGTWLATAGSHDGTIRTWDAATGQPRAAILTGIRGSIAVVAIAPDGTWLATAGYDDATVRIWDAASGRPRATLSGTDSTATVAIAPGGTLLATAHGGGTVRIWDVTTSRTMAVMRVDNHLNISAWGPRGQTLAVGGGSSLYYFDVKT